MTSPSIAETIFNQLQAMNAQARADFLKKYVDDNQHETDWLDFKACARIKSVKEDWIEKTWSKFLSAFANSGGGLLVWGIETKEDHVLKKDCAVNISLVPRPGELLSRLDQMQ